MVWFSIRLRFLNVLENFSFPQRRIMGRDVRYFGEFRIKHAPKDLNKVALYQDILILCKIAF